MDIIFSLILIAASVYLFALVGAESPARTPTELGAAFWPHIILGLLIVLLAVNLIGSIRRMKEDGTTVTAGIDLAGFFKSRLFIGMAVIVIMGLLLPRIGFLPTCVLFLTAYGILLKAESVPKLVIASVVITVLIYIVFQGALDILLPRGYGIFRSFALAVESMLPF